MSSLVEVVAAEVRVAVDASTSKTPSPTSRTDTSNVPPPRSKTRIFSFFFLSSPYASAAAVGSLRIAQDLEARDLAGVLRRLALGVVEVRGDGDDRLGTFSPR